MLPVGVAGELGVCAYKSRLRTCLINNQTRKITEFLFLDSATFDLSSILLFFHLKSCIDTQKGLDRET